MFLPIDPPAGFAQANVLETKILGQAAALIAIPVLLFFIWFDLVELGIREFLPARLISLGLFALSGLLLTLRPHHARLVNIAHGSALFGLVSMNCYMVFATLKFYPAVDLHLAMSTNTLAVVLFIVFLFSGGLRLALPLIAGVPLLILLLNVCVNGLRNSCTFGALVNPWLVLLIIVVLGVAQERAKRRERESVNLYLKDISAHKQREEKLVFETLHDPLTGLANRRFMQSRLKQAINRARRSYPSSLLFIDLDFFKAINDRYGHDAGDRVLVAIAKILLEGRRDYDSVFRIGGDEFAILVDGATIAEARVVAERIRAAVAGRHFEAMENNEVRLSLSIGGVLVDPSLSGDEIIKLADEAMYKAKQAGRNRVEMVEKQTE